MMISADLPTTSIFLRQHCPLPPEATEYEPEAVSAAPPTCAFPGCPRPPYVDPIGVTHQCCGRTCAGALLVLNAQNQTLTKPQSAWRFQKLSSLKPSRPTQAPVLHPPVLRQVGSHNPRSHKLQCSMVTAITLDLKSTVEYGGSGLDTGDEGEESTTGLLSRAISTIVRIDGPHIRIPPKCYIYVMTTTGRHSWMRPGVCVGVQFGSDMLSECHVGMRPPIAGQPACIKARDMDHALTICREQLVPAIYRGVRDIFGLTVWARQYQTLRPVTWTQ